MRLRHLINLGRPAHQMIQAMKSRRDKSSCKQVETSPWGLNGKEDERAKQQLASCLLPTKQHVWEYELLQKEAQPLPFTFAAMGEQANTSNAPFLNLTLYFSATTRTASRMRTTLRTTTQTGTGEGARLPPVGVLVPIWTPITRTPHSPRLSSLGTIIPSVSD